MTTSSDACARAPEYARFKTIGGRPPPREQLPRVALAPPLEGEPVRTRDGRELLLRTIHADDVDALRHGFADLTPEEVRLRFLHPMNELTVEAARRLCSIDPVREVAFVLLDRAAAPTPAIRAVARAYIDPATLAAEFAIVVHHDFAGQGLGTLLMRRLIDALRERGVVEIWGHVLTDNNGMLELAHNLGFTRHSDFHDPGILRVSLDLH